MDAERRRPLLLSVALLVLLGACDLGMPTEALYELSVDQADAWPDRIGLGVSAEVEVRITVTDGSTVTAAPVRWHSSDTSVVKVVAASLPSEATSRDSLAARLRATVTGVGRGSARITVLMDSLAGFTAGGLEHEVSVTERWIDVSGGGAFTCGVSLQNKAYCWGSGAYGELGNGGSREAYASPQPVAGDVAFTSIDAGWDHACARSTDGLVYCWGFNGAGELGTGSRLSQFVPTRVSLGRAFDQVTAGNGLSCGTLDVLERGAPDERNWAVCWGNNRQGQIGADGADDQVLVPDPSRRVGTWVSDPDAGQTFAELFFTSVSAGGAFACGIATTDTDLDAWCWGDNRQGQLGNGTWGPDAGTSTATPVGGPRLSSVVTSLASAGAEGAVGEVGEAEAGGRLHACGLTETGAAWCWGSNDGGQLGSGGASALESSPVAVAGGHRFIQLSLGEGHSCGLDASGKVHCWGRNDFGQVGDGQMNAAVPAPVAIDSGMRFAKVSAGAFHTCALTVPEDGGALYCWGRNDRAFDQKGGQLGDGTFEHNATPTRVVESTAGR